MGESDRSLGTCEESRETGVVKWFDAVRGFGFVGREGESDLFVHASAVEGEELRAGQRVSFRVADGARGLQAREVRAAPVLAGGPGGAAGEG